MHGKGDFHSDCQSGPLRVKSSFVFPALLLAEKVGSQDSGAGNNFPAQFGDPTNTMEALEELHPRAARGQDLLRNWWDLYVACQKQGAPEKVPASVGKRGRRVSLENSSGLKGRVLTGERHSQLEKSS